MSVIDSAFITKSMLICRRHLVRRVPLGQHTSYPPSVVSIQLHLSLRYGIGSPPAEAAITGCTYAGSRDSEAIKRTLIPFIPDPLFKCRLNHPVPPTLAARVQDPLPFVGFAERRRRAPS